MIIAEALNFQGLDDSLRKKAKRVGRKSKKVVRGVVKKVKRHFPKIAPFLSIAAQVLNLIVPGLGVAVSLAITAGNAALAVTQAKKAAKAAKKAETQAEIQAEAELTREAEESTLAAYEKGREHFEKEYGMTREKFTALPVEGRLKFFNLVLYDKNSERMRLMGVERSAFEKMSLDEQNQEISRMAAYLPGAPAPGEPEPEAPVEEAGIDWGIWAAVGGVGALVLVLGYVFLTRKS